MAILRSILEGLQTLLGNDSAMSIIFGLVISLGGTQYLKFRIPVPGPLQDEYRWFVRAISLPLGFFPVYFTWPLSHRLYVALSVALTAPTIYRLATALLYWKWPALEQRLSVKPSDGEQ